MRRQRGVAGFDPAQKFASALSWQEHATDAGADVVFTDSLSAAAAVLAGEATVSEVTMEGRKQTVRAWRHSL
jgi:hypothetical protein